MYCAIYCHRCREQEHNSHDSFRTVEGGQPVTLAWADQNVIVADGFYIALCTYHTRGLWCASYKCGDVYFCVSAHRGFECVCACMFVCVGVCGCVCVCVCVCVRVCVCMSPVCACVHVRVYETHVCASVYVRMCTHMTVGYSTYTLFHLYFLLFNWMIFWLFILHSV